MMVKDSELPPMFREDFEILYTAKQLEPTIERLHSAIEEDLKKGVGTPQQCLAAAWRRIAELRFPRKAVPQQVLNEVEELLGLWERSGPGGPESYAYSLSEEQILAEHERLKKMLRWTKEAAAQGPEQPLVETE